MGENASHHPGSIIDAICAELKRTPSTIGPTFPVEPMVPEHCDFCHAELLVANRPQPFRCPDCRATLYPCIACDVTFDSAECPVHDDKACKFDNGEDAYEACSVKRGEPR
jgi:predicted RNA-binding Zn-ribbon protein involved in translation (DUF1610 family)